MAEKTRDAYGYCYQNPINLVDPDGREADDWVKRDGKIIWDENVTSSKDKDLQKGDQYLGKAVIVFNGSRDEKLGKDNNLFGKGAKLASVTVYGPDGENDIEEYQGFTMTSDSKKFGAIADGTYSFNYDAKGKSGKLESHWAVEGRNEVPPLDGYNPNPNSKNKQFKSGIFIHTSNRNGAAGTYNKGKNGISEGCLLIVPSKYDKNGKALNNGWNQFNEQLSGVKKGTLILNRS